jgi:hypothetical protein
MFDLNALQKAAADDDKKKDDDAPAPEPEAPETPAPAVTPAATPEPAAPAAPIVPPPGTGAVAGNLTARATEPAPRPSFIQRGRTAIQSGRQRIEQGKQQVTRAQQGVEKTKQRVQKGKQLAAENQDTVDAARQSAQQRSIDPLAQHARGRLGLGATPGGPVLGGAPDPSIDAGPFELPADTDPAEAARLHGARPGMSMEEYQQRKQKRQAALQRRLAAPAAPPSREGVAGGTDRIIKDMMQGNEAERAAAIALHYGLTSEDPAAEMARTGIKKIMDSPTARAAGRGMRPWLIGDQTGAEAAQDLAVKVAPWLAGGYLGHRFILRPTARFLGGAYGAARNPAGSAAATAGANRAQYNQLVKQFRAAGMSRAAAKQQASTVLASMQAQAMNAQQTAQSMAAKGQAYTGQPAAAKPAAGGGLSKMLQGVSRRLAGLPGWGKALAGAGALGAGMYGGNKLLSASHGSGAIKQANPLMTRALPLLQRAKTGLGKWWGGLSPTAKTVGVGLAAAPTLSYMLGAGQQPQQAPQHMYDPTMQGTMTALPFQSMQRMPSLFERQMQMMRYASADEPMTKKATVELEMDAGSMQTFRA